MIQELSAVDVYFLVKELRSLVKGKFEKIYQIDDSLLFKLYVLGDKKLLKCVVPGFLSVSEKDFDAPDFPPDFCSLLRKHISGGTILEVYQKGFERIVVFDVSSKGINYSLIFELFKPGNVVLVKMPDLIMDSFVRKRFKDRLIAPKKNYEFPPAQTDFTSITESGLFVLLSESNRSVVKTLASLGLGGIWAEEVLFRAGVDKNIKKVSIEDSKKIFLAIKGLLDEKISPVLFEGKVFPVEMKSFSGDSLDSSFSEALDAHSFREEAVVIEKKSKYLDLVKVQEKRIVELEDEIKINQEKGDFIYQNYQDFNDLLFKIKALRKSKSFDEIELLLKKNSKFKELNKKEKKIVLEF